MRTLRLRQGQTIWLNAAGTVESYFVRAVLTVGDQQVISAFRGKSGSDHAVVALPLHNGFVERRIKTTVIPKAETCCPFCVQKIYPTTTSTVYCKIYRSKRKAVGGVMKESPRWGGCYVPNTSKDDFAAKAIVTIKKQLRAGLTEFEGKPNNATSRNAIFAAMEKIARLNLDSLIRARTAEPHPYQQYQPINIEPEPEGKPQIRFLDWTQIRKEPFTAIRILKDGV